MSRPRSITFLCIILFGLSFFNLVGAVSTYQRLEFLRQLPLSVAPEYLLVRNAVWAAVFTVLADGLWHMRPRARLATLIGFALYLAHGWLERVLLAQADYVRLASPWAGWVDLISLALIAVILWRVRRRYPNPSSGPPSSTPPSNSHSEPQ